MTTHNGAQNTYTRSLPARAQVMLQRELEALGLTFDQVQDALNSRLGDLADTLPRATIQRAIQL